MQRRKRSLVGRGGVFRYVTRSLSPPALLITRQRNGDNSLQGTFLGSAPLDGSNSSSNVQHNVEVVERNEASSSGDAKTIENDPANVILGNTPAVDSSVQQRSDNSLLLWFYGYTEARNLALGFSLRNATADATTQANVGTMDVRGMPQAVESIVSRGAVYRSRGQRGPDRIPGSRPPRKCPRCEKWSPAHKFACTGRGGSAKCDLFDDDGKRRCGRCKRAHNLEKVEEGRPKTRGLNAYSCMGATCPIDNFDSKTCEYYDVRHRPRPRQNP